MDIKTTFDWAPPVGGGNGCAVTNGGNTLTYFNGAATVALGVGAPGIVNDIPGSSTDFFAFPSAPTLHFNLTQLGPGVANTVCSGLVIGQSCSPTAGSPLILTATAIGTGVEIDASGTAGDASGSDTWMGSFTTEIAGVSAASVQATLASGGSVTSTWSGTFPISPAKFPEPGSVSLLLTAMAGVGLVGFRHRRLKPRD